jgi:hypothetical protein
MQVIEKLTTKNFQLYAFRNYNNPQCVDLDEYEEDLNRFKYLKKLLNRYRKTGDIQHRLVMNHLITIINVFGIEPGMKMLKYKMDEDHWSILKPFLLYLSYITVHDLPGVPLDPYVVQVLRNEN